MECDIVGPHLNSFNWMINEGLDAAVQDLLPEETETKNGRHVCLELSNPFVGYPSLSREGQAIDGVKLFPMECRQRGLTYKAKLNATVTLTVDGTVVDRLETISVGEIPIMLKSSRCHLQHFTQKQLIANYEEENELGGYFIVNGMEKIVRLHIVPRRNFPLALARRQWKQRGQYFTEYGVQVHCVRGSHTASNLVLHYLWDRRVMLCFFYKKEQFLVPLVIILRALFDCPDKFLYEALIRGKEQDEFWKGNVANMLSDLVKEKIKNQVDALRLLGSLFRVALYRPSFVSDVDVGRFLMRCCICIHLSDERAKFDFLVFCAQKLASLVRGEIVEESPDNPMFQEVGTPGHLILMLIRDRLQAWLNRIRWVLQQGDHSDLRAIRTAFRGAIAASVKGFTKAVEYFFATGNLNTNIDLGLQDVSGFVILAERLNHLRFISHFRGVHRGAFYLQMRSTEVRKLRPESWGFICPVHTPDGAPCGLLNHLTASCCISYSQSTKTVLELLPKCGVILNNTLGASRKVGGVDYYHVIVDGRVAGLVDQVGARKLEALLRALKAKSSVNKVKKFIEVAFIERTTFKGFFPAFYVFTESERMMRPVRNLYFDPPDNIEFIGTLEQAFMSICIYPSDVEPETTHQEVAPTSFLSYVANLIPYPDHNQSPRNVYQCQMSKQTVGYPVHSHRYRTDDKLYKLQTPQMPVVRTSAYDRYDVNEYPLGTNAIVAVISYTGYDMEDAMIVNKSSFERGFAHASIYKTERIRLNNYSKRSIRESKLMFHRDPTQPELANYIDSDGLPHIGRLCVENEPFYCVLEINTGNYTVKNYTGHEDMFVDNIKIVGADDGSELIDHVCVTLRLQRNPAVGDKFASRHGQKGINSFLWPAENMPFTESGMVPDIIFNPHGYPSRMTIGMMIESMAGKSAACHGLRHDASPFVFDDQNKAVEYYGRLLQIAGFNYYGNERMYSGIDGREFEVDIFFGIVYYQRLRHMVADKFQVRATGPVDPLTRQPIHGRARGGGVRFGEMERDAIIAYGTSFLLKDRLFDCSDKVNMLVCNTCHSSISVCFQRLEIDQKLSDNATSGVVNDMTKRNVCRFCNSDKDVKRISVPHVLKYLVSELASVNVKINFEISDRF